MRVTSSALTPAPMPGAGRVEGRDGAAADGLQVDPLAGVALGVDVGDVLAGDVERAPLRPERGRRRVQAGEGAHRAPSRVTARCEPSSACGRWRRRCRPSGVRTDSSASPMAARPPSISSRLASDRLRRSVTRTSSASWCLANRSFHGAGAASATWRSDGLAPRPSRDGDRLGGRGALHLEGAQLVEDHLDLVGDARQPAGLAREDQVLLLLGLEQQQVQELLLPPQQRRQVLVVHVSTALPSSRSVDPRAGRSRCSGGSSSTLPSAPRREGLKPKPTSRLSSSARKSAEGGAMRARVSREEGREPSPCPGDRAPPA